jgi:transposase-like protein
LEVIIDDQMAAAVDRPLHQLQTGDAADRRNDYYSRHLPTELGDIEFDVPRTRRYSPTEVVRAYARRSREIRILFAVFTRKQVTGRQHPLPADTEQFDITVAITRAARPASRRI